MENLLLGGGVGWPCKIESRKNSCPSILAIQAKNDRLVPLFVLPCFENKIRPNKTGKFLPFFCIAGDFQPPCVVCYASLSNGFVTKENIVSASSSVHIV